jgi:predicted 3-demethylubiquinone-9 3-methyltransferase (glyoxalase superfamily)
MFMGERAIRQNITPTLMFVGDVCGKVEEAISRYTSVFRHSKAEGLLRYGKGEEQGGDGKHAAFTLEGREFAAMDSARAHPFTFNVAISFVVNGETQDEIDYYGEKGYPPTQRRDARQRSVVTTGDRLDGTCRRIDWAGH